MTHGADGLGTAVPRPRVTDSWPTEAVQLIDRLSTTVRSLRDENGQLVHALESRIAVEQAKGILAERLGLTLDEAFAVMRAAARRDRIRVHDLARVVTADPATPEPIRDELARPQRAPGRVTA